jgi:hypothetical protein
MLLSFIQGLRAARRIGAAARRQQAADPEGALRAYASALDVLSGPRVDLETPWCSAGAQVRWRPSCLKWLGGAATHEMSRQIEELEKLYQALSRENGPPIAREVTF